MLVINYLSAAANASVQLGDEWRIHPTDELLTRLKRILKQDNTVTIKYR